MEAAIKCRSASGFKLEIEIPYSDNMLKAEEIIQHALNEGGILATKEMMELHDTDGSPTTNSVNCFGLSKQKPTNQRVRERLSRGDRRR